MEDLGITGKIILTGVYPSMDYALVNGSPIYLLVYRVTDTNRPEKTKSSPSFPVYQVI